MADRPSLRGYAHPRSVRARVTLVTSAVVALLLVVASIGLVLAQRALLTRSVDDVLTVRAREIAAAHVAGEPPPSTADGIAWQVLAEDDVPLASGPVTPDELEPPLRTVTVAVGDTGDVVRAVASMDEVLDAVEVLATSLAVGVPITVLLLGGVIWAVVGRTLRPVEDIRTEVATIGGTDLHRRVPDPGTGDEVARLAATMNDMLDRLEDSVATQRRFVADASHELRSPITRIRTQLEVAAPDDDVASLRASLLEDAGELADLVDDLLFLARSDAPGAPLAADPVDLDEVVLREAARVRRPDGPTVDTSAVSAADVRGDAAALARAVRNLLDNAVRHARSRVTVTLSEDGGQARLVVADDGPGIPPDDAERVFERFTRLDEARTRDDGGAGLGLAIVREIVARHGGDARVDGDATDGARLVLRLPVVQDSL